MAGEREPSALPEGVFSIYSFFFLTVVGCGGEVSPFCRLISLVADSVPLLGGFNELGG